MRSKTPGLEEEGYKMSEETFEALLAPNLQSVRKLVQSRLRAADHADDIVQQTLLRAFAFRHQLRSPSKFRSWIWSIALNEVRMFLRAARPFVSFEESPNRHITDPTPSPLAMCEQVETSQRLRAGMARLSPRDRTAIQLADLNELSCAEAANAMAISLSAFKSTHFRARQRLENTLRVTEALTKPAILPKGKQANGHQPNSTRRNTYPRRIAA
jgi:RNA polymerase sigma-70 factor (ECF subfamily)